MAKHSIVWVKTDGAEQVDIELADSRLIAEGMAIGSNPLPYRLEYTLTTTDQYVTRELYVRTYGNDPDLGTWERSLILTRSEAGKWSCSTHYKGQVQLPIPGGDLTALDDVNDCDLGLSPLTNTLPIKRIWDSKGIGSFPFVMAWVSVPDLQVKADRQTYTFNTVSPEETTYIQYASERWNNRLKVDVDGFIIDYPEIGSMTAHIKA